MPWRTNVGRPLQLRNSNPNSPESENLLDDDGNHEHVDSWDSEHFSDQVVDEFLNSAWHSFSERQQFDDFDSEALQEDVDSWNNRPEVGPASSNSAFDWELVEGREHDGGAEPVVDQAEFAKIVSNAVVANTSVDCPLLPWERAPFNEIFGTTGQSTARSFVPIFNAGLDNFHPEENIPDMVACAAATPSRPDDISSKVITKVADISYET